MIIKDYADIVQVADDDLTNVFYFQRLIGFSDEALLARFHSKEELYHLDDDGAESLITTLQELKDAKGFNAIVIEHIPEDMKRCTKHDCKQPIQTLDQFPIVEQRGKRKHRSHCRTCERARMKLVNKSPKAKQYQTTYNEKHPKRVLDSQQRYRARRKLMFDFYKDYTENDGQNLADIIEQVESLRRA